MSELARSAGRCERDDQVPHTLAPIRPRRILSGMAFLPSIPAPPVGYFALSLKRPPRDRKREERLDDRRKRPVQIPGQRRLGETARWVVVQGGRRGRLRQPGQYLRLQSRRAS